MKLFDKLINWLKQIKVIKSLPIGRYIIGAEKGSTIDYSVIMIWYINPDGMTILIDEKLLDLRKLPEEERHHQFIKEVEAMAKQYNIKQSEIGKL